MAGSGNDVRLGAFVVHQSQAVGEGSFGSVYKGTYMKQKSAVAVKQIKYLTPDAMGKTVMLGMAQKEIKSLMILNGHPNIVRYYDHFDDGTSFWLVMEYCPLGDLDNYLTSQNQTPTSTKKIDLMLQCAQAIAFMHSFEPPFVHRDIKLKNFLVTRSPDGKEVVKVTDFGVAKLLEDKLGSHGIMKTLAGTPSFMAPEFWEADEELAYTVSIDIFSLGLVFQALLLYPQSQTEKDGILPVQVDGSDLAMLPLGMQILHAVKQKLTVPNIVKIEDGESEVDKKVKLLIQDMTHYEGEKRKDLWIVVDDLEKILQAGENSQTDEVESENSEEESTEQDAEKRGNNPMTESQQLAMSDKTDDDKKQPAESSILFSQEFDLNKGNYMKTQQSEVLETEASKTSFTSPKHAWATILDVPGKTAETEEVEKEQNVSPIKKSPSSAKEATETGSNKPLSSPIETAERPPLEMDEEKRRLYYDVTNIGDFNTLDHIRKQLEQSFKANLLDDTSAGTSKGAVPKTSSKPTTHTPSERKSSSPPKHTASHETDVKTFKMTVYKNPIDKVSDRKKLFEQNPTDNTQTKPMKPTIKKKPHYDEAEKLDLFKVSNIHDFESLEKKKNQLFGKKT